MIYTDSSGKIILDVQWGGYKARMRDPKID